LKTLARHCIAADKPSAEHRFRGEISVAVQPHHVMLDVLPIGDMHFPGAGIQDNLADKAKKLGITVWKFGGA
jgi:hypothetical protein